MTKLSLSFQFIFKVGTNILHIETFPEVDTWLSPGVLGALICAYGNWSTRQTNQCELRLHYTLSFTDKLTLMTFFMKSKISSTVRFEPITFRKSAQGSTFRQWCIFTVVRRYGTSNLFYGTSNLFYGRVKILFFNFSTVRWDDWTFPRLCYIFYLEYLLS